MLLFGALSRYHRQLTLVDTGWVQVADNGTTNVVVPAGEIVSMKVRWKGISDTETDSDSNTESGSKSGGSSASSTVSYPSKPAGWSWDRVKAYTSVSAATSGSWEVYAEATSSERQLNSGTGTGGSASVTDYGTPDRSYSYHSASHTQAFNYTFRATSYFERDVDTSNPQITVNSQVTSLTDTLNNNEESAWVTATGFTAGATNSVRHDMGGSDKAYVQIQVEVLV